MTKVGNAMEKVREKLTDKAEKFMPDVCTVVDMTEVQDGSGGTVPSETSVIANLLCSYKPLRVPMVQQVAGGPTTILTHEVTTPATAATQLITTDHELRVKARGKTPAITFKHPVRLDNAMSPFLTLAAALRIP